MPEGATVRKLVGATVVIVALGSGALAQDTPAPTDKKVKYSPYPEENFPDRVFYGDTHLHTSYSTDAGMIGCTLGPEDAYRFARGETVVSSTGVPARLRRPYDFLVVANHSENLGLAPAIRESNPELLKNPWGKMEHDLVKTGLEIPTPRWTTFVAKIFGVELPKDVPPSIQERAYTSPIWYTP